MNEFETKLIKCSNAHKLKRPVFTVYAMRVLMRDCVLFCNVLAAFASWMEELRTV